MLPLKRFCKITMADQLIVLGDDARRLSTRLSDLTGEDLDVAVVEALKQRLQRVSESKPAPRHGAQEQDRAARMARIRVIAADIREATAGNVSSDHSWLYDDKTGLPR
jgi:antitoxin VapB